MSIVTRKNELCNTIKLKIKKEVEEEEEEGEEAKKKKKKESVIFAD